MNRHKTELTGALLDGELKGLRRWLAVRHIRNCPVCATEYRQQRHARRVLCANPPTAQMSDSPRFFWSKVKDEIQRRGDEPITVPTPRLTVADWLSQRGLALASVTAAAVAALGVLWFAQSRRPAPSPVVAVTKPEQAKVEIVATVLPHTVATVVRVPDSEAPVIWVSGLTWTPDMTEMKTHFATSDI